MDTDDIEREDMLGDVNDLLPDQIKLVMLDSNGQQGYEIFTSVSTLTRATWGSNLYSIATRVRDRKDPRGVFYIDRAADNFHHILNYLRYETIPDEVKNDEDFRQQLLAEAKYYSMEGLQNKLQAPNPATGIPVSSQRDLSGLLTGEIKLIVGGTVFITTISTLKLAPGHTTLWRIGNNCEEFADKRGHRCIDRSPEYFCHVLEYLRNGTVPIEEARRSPQLREALLKEARYYELPDMASKISETNAN